MKKERPVNLDLTKFHFPPMAIISICHRISGVLIFLLLPLLLCLLHGSLISADSFAATQSLITHPIIKFLLWLVCSAVLFHLVAGIRHLIMDLGYAETVNAGRISAYLVFAIAILLFLLVGIWLW